MNYRHYVFYLREFFFPYGCGSCGEALLCPEDAFFGLCADCRSFFSQALGNECCRICGKALISEKGVCLSCRKKDGNYNECLVRVKTLFPYTGSFRKILRAYKFGRSLGLGNFFSLCLNQSLDDLKYTALVPVPPRSGKVKKLGWDQIEYIAGLMARDYGLPVSRCLKRLPSRSQKELNREERESNLEGRIICKRKPPGTVILFDDVITTGATLNVCARALVEGGAEKVYGLCLFYD